MFVTVGRVPLVLGQACLQVPPIGGQVQIEFQQSFQLASTLLLVVMFDPRESFLVFIADPRVIIQRLPHL